MKRSLSLVLALVLVCALCPAGAAAEPGGPAAPYSGICGAAGRESSLRWTLDADGLLTITGTGEMGDYLIQNAPWEAYSSKITAVEVGDGVTRIGEAAFMDCTALSDLALPDSVVTIDYSAFFNCAGLTSIVLPDGLTTVENEAFAWCTNLVSVTLPAGVSKLGDRAFSNCDIAMVRFLGDVPQTGQSIFDGCAGLTAYYPPENATWTEAARNQFSGNIVWEPDNRVEESYSGTCGAPGSEDSVTWTLEHGILTIRGVGAMGNCSCSRPAPWKPYRYNINSLVVEQGVTRIGVRSFENCINLAGVTLPDSLDSIGAQAFYGCASLRYVKVPDSVSTIEKLAFQNCTGLTSVDLPDQITNFDDGNPFVGCINLTGVSTSGEHPTTEVRDGALINNKTGELLQYLGGSSATAYTVPDAVISIGENAFAGCTNLTSVTIPEGVTTIGWQAFENCTGLTSVKLPGSLTTIDGLAFSGCTALPGVTIPEGVTTIGNAAFSDCTALTDVTLPSSLTAIQDFAFSGCIGLTGLKFPEGLTTIGKWTFSYCTGLTDITLPDSLTDLGGWAFFGCTSLPAVTLPGNLSIIGNYAFADCASLSDITVSPENRTFAVRDGALIDETRGRLVCFPENRSATSYIVPDTVRSIGDGAFWHCGGLKSITIPSSVSTISDYAFYRCFALKSVTIPASVVYLGDWAFADCGRLTMVKFEGNAPRRNWLYPWETWSTFYGNTMTAYYPAEDPTWTEEARSRYEGTITWKPYGGEITDIASGTCGAEGNETGVTWVLAADSTLTIRGTGPMRDFSSGAETPWASYRTNADSSNSIMSVVVEDGVTTVGTYAFEDCASLREVTLPDSVTTIGDYAFWRCRFLFNIVIPDGVATVGAYAFENCTSLREVTLPSSMTSIGEAAFFRCAGLTHVTIPGSVTTIGGSAFSDCKNLTAITMLDGVTSIGDAAFFRCVGLTHVTIPGSVTTIGGSAFEDCENLTGITMLDGVTSIGSYAFFGCAALSDVTLPASLTYIGVQSFAECTSLTGITLPSSLTTIDSWAFDNCTNLTDLYYTGSEAQWEVIRFNDPIIDSADLHCHSYYAASGKAAGSLGENKELSWAYEDGKLEFVQPVPEEELVLAAAYDETGRFEGVKLITAKEASVQIGAPAKFKLFWVDGSSAPQCPAVTVAK